VGGVASGLGLCGGASDGVDGGVLLWGVGGMDLVFVGGEWVFALPAFQLF